MKPTEVILTVDLEFSSGGYLVDPASNSPIGSRCVDLEVGGQPQGLPLMLDILRQYGVSATFFVETGQVLYFGPDEMGRHVRSVLDAGHDTQLHLHPQWIFCRQIKDGVAGAADKATDSMAELDAQQARQLIESGIEAFDLWGAPRPVALRTGNLQVSSSVYDVMADAGLRLSSNIGIGVWLPAEPQLVLNNGRHQFGSVTEIPVFSYVALHLGPLLRKKTLTITGASKLEMTTVLHLARTAGIQEVVILTHAHEFVKRDSARYRSIVPNRLNQSRLDYLCNWVSNRPDEFRFATFAEKAGEWLNGANSPSMDVTLPPIAALTSVVQNGLSDRIRSF